MKNPARSIKLLASTLLLATLFFTSCKSDKQVDQQSTASAGTTATEAEAAPPHFKSERAAVLVGFWHYAMVVGDDKDREMYQNRWIEIKRDDTFVSGLFDKETNSGTWTFADDRETVILNYNKKDEALAYEWKIQGYGDMLIWKGDLNSSNAKSTQIKMMKQKGVIYPGATQE